MTAKPPRLCLFCGRGKLSKEHFWPAWAEPYLPNAAAREETTRIFTGNHLDDRTITRPGSLKQKKLRVVCRSCNNEWMSGLEESAMGVVRPLLLGDGLLLDDSAQRVLARWVALKVMVAEQSRPEDAVVTSQQCVEFMQSGRIPDLFEIVLARCGEAPWDTMMFKETAHLFPSEHAPADIAVAKLRKNVQTTTFGIGQLLVHCIVRAADSVDLAKKVAHYPPLLRLWPLTGNAIVWPPAGRLRAVDADRVATRISVLKNSGTVKYIA